MQAFDSVGVSNRRWQRILEGSLAERASSALLRIAHDLDSPDIEPEPAELVVPYSLGYGSAGISLLFAYLAHCFPEEHNFERIATRLLHESTESISRVKMSPSFFRGFLGIIWAFLHVHQRIKHEQIDPESWLEIDEILLDWSRKPLAASELMTGISAICLYAAEHAVLPGGLTKGVLQELQKRAIRHSSGVTWQLSPEMIDHMRTDHQDQVRSSSGVISSVNVAHGVAGIAGAVASLHGSSIYRDECKSLAEDAVDWILSQRLHKIDASQCNEWFPQFTGIESPRLCTGWCNGDLGISIVLFNIALSIGRPDWRDFALSLARKEATKRLAEIEECNRPNYGICHGAAGRVHILNCFFQETGDEAFAGAARFWIEHILSMQGSEGGIGGFWLNEIDGTKAAKGLLTGASGLALVLLAAVTDVPPEWDRAFLISMCPPRS